MKIPMKNQSQNKALGWALLVSGVIGAIYAGVKILKPIGIKNNNPGNLRPEYPDVYQWRGEIGIYHSEKSGDFLVFEKPFDGIRACALTALTWYERGKTTLRKLGLTWSPPGDNQGDETYGVHLAERLGVSPDAPFDYVGRLQELVVAISYNENSEFPQEWEKDLLPAVQEAKAKRGYV